MYSSSDQGAYGDKRHSMETYPGNLQQRPGVAPYYPQQPQHSFPYPDFSPPNPYYPHTSSASAYPQSAALSQPPHGSSSYSTNPPPSYYSGGHSPSRPNPSPSPYPPTSSASYPPLSSSHGYPSHPPVSQGAFPSRQSFSQPPSSQPSAPFAPPEQGAVGLSSTGSFVQGHQRLDNSSQNIIVPYAGRSLKYYLLYGSLDVWIHSASNLPNLDFFSESLRQALSTVEPAIPKMRKSLSKRITSDPYVSVVLKGATLARTTVISNNQDPVWEEHFNIHVAHKVADIEFVVKDNDMVGSQYIGEVKITAESLLSRAIQGESFELINKEGKPIKQGARLKLSVSYCPLERDPLYRYGVGGPPYQGVPNTYFPLRTGGRVTLYQDAHVPRNCLPMIGLGGGLNFEHRSCWEDICQAIIDAQHLIYITGWSVYTKIKLVRDNDRERHMMCYKELGELLKWKADKGGVRVLLLVWDDKTSHAVINKVGVMGTHDEETRVYFRKSGVKCLLAPRYADSKLSWAKQQMVGTIYTHHQKTVIVDAKGSTDRRRLVAFLGGLDLCDGRYDSPEHTLFCRLHTDYKEDYHNPTFPTKVDSGGPREPWHDLHCKIEGPAVYDVLTNFEQRWRKVSKWHPFGLKIQKKGGFNEDFLIDLQQKSWALIDRNDKANSIVTTDNDPESWHIQVFRSIDSGSVKGFPKNAMDAEKQKLVGQKNIAIDMSIHTAYIDAIRSAQHFIYIENQYFLGSSFAWPTYKTAGANHLVPIEIALKIVSKIKARQPFAVYVVIPMWPEGDPNTNAVQEILYFQGQTMEMMYTLIAEALKEEQLENTQHPTDYLNFFCLGNRELKKGAEPLPTVQPVEGSNQARAFKSRRFMIYVHSKGMIVDDEYIILGSANINQRSMDGSRDTEIAMGAYQPYHTWANVCTAPKGQIHGYRLSLWAEHLRVIQPCFMEPWSQQCVKTVQYLADRNWKQFSGDELVETEGHLLRYPVEVKQNGKVVALDKFDVFPDVGGKILGISTTLPDNLTA